MARDHTLDPVTFSPCIDLCRQLKEIHTQQQAASTEAIKAREEALGVAPPVLKDDQSVVTCSMYSGGLVISGVYPVDMFLDFVPKSQDEVFTKIFAMQCGSVEDIPPKQLPSMEAEARSLAKKIWKEIQSICDKKDGIILIMETKFDPTYEYGYSLLRQKVGNLVSSPDGLAYLFYKHECKKRLVKHKYILFNTDRESRTVMEHWSDEKPSVSFRNKGGYDCRVKFTCLV